MSDTLVTGFRLAPQQRRALGLADEGPGQRAQIVAVVRDDIDEARLRAAVASVVERHEVLRTTLVRHAGRRWPVQVVVPELAPGWRTQNGTPLAELVDDEARPFDLEQGPVLRVCLTRGEHGPRRLILSAPAVLSDAASLRVLLREIAAECEDGAPAPGEPIQYPDAAEVMNELVEADRSAEGPSFWRGQASRARVEPRLPFERAHRPDGPFEPRRVERVVDAADVLEAARQAGVSPTAVLLCAWQALLARLTGAGELTVGVGHDGRTHEGLDQALGLFARYLPVTARISGATRAGDALAATEAALRAAAEWQDFFAWDVEAPGEAPARLALGFDSLVDDTPAADAALRLESDTTCLEPFRVRLAPSLAGRELRLRLVYDARCVDDTEAARVLARYARVLLDVTRRPQAACAELELLPDDERRVLLELGGASALASAPPARVFLDEFEAHVERAPRQAAVVSGAETLDYGELDERANRLAHVLRAHGAGPEAPVALFLERSAAALVGLLGVLKSGAAYVPIDTGTPPARLAHLLGDVGACAVVTRTALLAQLPEGPWARVCLDAAARQLEHAGPTRPARATHPAQLAYVIYTSGSTGMPKGVGVTHANLANYVSFIRQRLELRRGWHFGLLTTLAADLGHTVLFGALASGGCLHVFPPETAGDALAFARACAERPLDVLKALPSHFSALLGQGEAPQVLPRRFLVLGGEALSSELCRRVAALGSACRILNHYGPTETTVGSLTRLVEPAGEWSATVPIGRPIADTYVRVLDARGELVPLGVAGELAIGGGGVARGYRGRPELTAERFVPDPFAATAGARLYRTGDRVRQRADGSVEFLGRVDEQVKIRGYRVEPGEVAAVLAAAPGVGQAFVLARRDEAGEARLVAYVCPAAPAALEHTALRAFAAERLPEHMLPAAFVTLDALPRTTAGKIDRAALPVPEAAAGAYTAPRDEVERQLAEVWAEVLRLPRVGVHDNFFDLGGDSILGIQIAARARRFSLELKPLDIFRHPNVAELARAVGRSGQREAAAPAASAAPSVAGFDEPTLVALVRGLSRARVDADPAPVTRDDVEAVHHLSPLQQGILFHCAYDVGARPYVTQVAYTLAPGADAEAFAAAWQHVTERHAMLRTGFVWQGLDEPLQAVLRGLRAPLAHHDLSELAPAEREAALSACAERDLAAASRLGQAPLFRVRLVHLDGGRLRCVFTYHHLLLDGWSEVILASELAESYAELRAGRAPRLPPVRPYGDYIGWLHGRDLSAAETFWRRELGDFATPTTLPGPRSSESSHAPAVRVRRVSAERSAAVEALARRLRLTPNTLAQGAWALALGQASGRDDVVFGATLAGRPAALDGVESIVGPFINTLPVRVRVQPAVTVSAWLAQLQARQLELREHELTPLVQIQRWSGVPPGQPLFETLLVFQNAPSAEGGASLEVEDVLVNDGATNFPLSLDVRPGRELVVLATHDPARLSAAAVDGLLETFEGALEGFATAPEAALGGLLERLREQSRTRRERHDAEVAAAGLARLKSAGRRGVTLVGKEGA